MSLSKPYKQYSVRCGHLKVLHQEQILTEIVQCHPLDILTGWSRGFWTVDEEHEDIALFWAEKNNINYSTRISLIMNLRASMQFLVLIPKYPIFQSLRTLCSGVSIQSAVLAQRHLYFNQCDYSLILAVSNNFFIKLRLAQKLQTGIFYLILLVLLRLGHFYTQETQISPMEVVSARKDSSMYFS